MKTPTDQDCYLFMDYELPLEKRKISILCVECHNKHKPDTGMFYKGSVEGYGPFEFKCCMCENVIHAIEEPLEN